VSENGEQQRLQEIATLRQRGLITAQEAYERHLAVVGAAPSATAPEQTAEGSFSRATLLLWAVIVAAIGGLLAIPAAFLQELTNGGFFVVFVGAPIIEEALKPAGVYILLIRWPHALLGRFHTAILSAVAGLCFALIESLLYVELYFPEGSSDYVLFRFTVPVALHIIASFVVGLGLSRSLIDWAAGRAPLSKSTRNFYIAGASIHAVYNTTAVVLSLIGVLDFERDLP
jgi:RsiW-degrading membrane proteinase PrsW (M82 family)